MKCSRKNEDIARSVIGTTVLLFVAVYLPTLVIEETGQSFVYSMIIVLGGYVMIFSLIAFIFVTIGWFSGELNICKRNY